MATPIMNEIRNQQLNGISDTELLRLIANQLGAGSGGSGGSSSSTILIQTVGFLLAPPGTTKQALDYYGVTNNVKHIVYTGGSVTRTITFTYVGGGVSSNDNVSNISQADS